MKQLMVKKSVRINDMQYNIYYEYQKLGLELTHDNMLSNRQSIGALLKLSVLNDEPLKNK